jgi:hypothetical protein
VKDQDKRISALINLLQDEDLKVASLAMEQFLLLGDETERAIAEYQDDGNPQLRQRIHQLTGIVRRRRQRQEFTDDVLAENMSIWDGVCRINELYDPQCNRRIIDRGVSEATKSVAHRRKVSIPHLAALMRQSEFSVPGEDIMDVDLYLAEDVMETRFGSSIVLCALAHEIGLRRGLNTTVALHRGQYCLADAKGMLLSPLNNWQVSKIEEKDPIHPCAPRDVWIGVLGQLFTVALVEGQLRDLSHLGFILTALNGDDLDTLPYPLGGA